MTDKLQRELVEAALDGDIDSFGKLCGSYYSSMVAIAYSVLTDHHLAEDAAQEAFARALKNLRKLKEKGKFALWLARICRNVAKDIAKARSKQINTEDFSQIPDSRVNDLNDQVVRQTISKLPLPERELIVLRYYNDFSYEQMSAVLGISKPAINGRLNRARRKMAKYLKRDGFDEVQL